MSHGFELIDELAGVRHWRRPDNGLRLLTATTPVAPVVAFGVVYRVGSRHEGTGQTGATHFLEHLMFRGSEHFNRERGTEIARLLQRVGASFNATTWLDRTNYYETLPVEHLGLAVDIEADRMRAALIRDEDVAAERTVILNELDRGENEPFELLMRGTFAHAFLEHPYHHPTIGWRSDVEAMSAATLRAFYDAYYHPGNAWVIVVGDLDEARALAEVERGFACLASGPAALPERLVVEPEQRGERRFTVRRAGEVASLALSWRVPAGLHPDLPALQVLTQVLSEGVTSRLHQRLVETSLCLGVHAFALELAHPGLFQVHATVAPGVDPAAVEEIVRREVTALGRAEASEAEIARARVQVRTDMAFHRESPAQMVAALTESVAVGDWRQFLSELDQVAAVEGDDLLRVAATHLVDDGLTVGLFAPTGNGGGAGSGRVGPRPCFAREPSRPLAERVELRDLPGGARLAVVASPHSPTFTLAGSLLAGPAHEPGGRLALPGLVAAMLERGTERHDRLALATELEDHGLELDVHTSASSPTVVSLGARGLAEELPRLAGLLVDLLRRPTFPATELERLRQQVLGALTREQYETFPRAFAALTQHLYPLGHPLRRRPLELRRAEVEALGVADLAAFHRAAYSPASLILVVVGAVAADAVAELFAGHLAGWSGGRAVLPPMPAPLPAAPGRELVDLPDRPNLDLLLGHAGSLLLGAPDEAAAMLANSCLGQSTLTSRLGAVVRDQAGLTYGIYSRFFGTVQVPGPWATFLSVSTGDLERAVDLVRDVVASYVATGPDEAELADERSAVAGSFQVGLATNAGVAREIALLLTAGLGVDYLDRYPRQVLATGRDEVVAAVARHFHPDALVVTAAGTLGEG